MARQAGPAWIDHLSTVLMGLRASIREDSLVSPAELVFGAPFRLPGAVFEPATESADTLDEFVHSLRSHLASLAPHPVLYHAKDRGSLPRSLQHAPAVFLRIDAVRRPLQPPYEGPFPVVRRGPKTFVIKRGVKEVTVSVDRLKPAFSCIPALPTPPSVLPATGPVPRTALARPLTSGRPLQRPVHVPETPLATRTRSGLLSRPSVRFAD